MGSDMHTPLAALLSGDLPVVTIDVLLGRPAWHRDAACREHQEIDWVPKRGAAAASKARASAVCAACSVRRECLEYALADPGIVGYWAGTSARDRDRARAAGLTAELVLNEQRAIA